MGIRRQGQKLATEEKKDARKAFLEAFAMSANVLAACKFAGVNRNTFYYWLEHDELFSLDYHQAEADANDRLRAEIWRRGVQGVEQPVVSAGKLVYTPDGEPLLIREYSDKMLELLARARLPEFKEKQDTRESPDQNANKLAIDLTKLTTEELATLKAIAERVEGRA